MPYVQLRNASVWRLRAVGGPALPTSGHASTPSRHRRPAAAPAASTSAAPTARDALQQERLTQTLLVDRISEELDIDSLVSLTFHGEDEIRGLASAEPVRAAALLTVPIANTLAVCMDEDGGNLKVVAPPSMPPNVKKAFEAVAVLVRETPDHQLLLLAALLLWARKFGGPAWEGYCAALLPPPAELSTLLSYSPGEMPALQLPHLMSEAAIQHDWARWCHSQWLSSSSGALRRLGLADDLSDTVWALGVVRSRAVEFPLGLVGPTGTASAAAAAAAAAAGSASGAGGAVASTAAYVPTGPVMALLAPVIDLANHSPDPNCVIQLTPDRSKVLLLPRRPVAAGEPLTVDYGFNRSSLDLMVDYGFVTPANPLDGATPLPGADKLPPLDANKLNTAAKALTRQRRAARQQLRLQAAAAARAAAGDDAAAPAQVEAESVEGEDGVVMQLAESPEAAEDAEEAAFSGRLKAAVALLSPRAPAGLPPGAGGSFSTPATQRIIGGLWHKLVRHTADSLPTSLEADAGLLADIGAGAVSGLDCGMALELDPQSANPPRPKTVSPDAAKNALRRMTKAQAPPPLDAEGNLVSPASSTGSGSSSPAAANSDSDGSSSGSDEAGTTAMSTAPFRRVADNGAEGNRTDNGAVKGVIMTDRQGAVAGRRRGPARSGRRVGRLYAAARARHEYKLLLRTAEELLMLYAK
ncbi:hypothetical protein HYH02_009063 [Chlamydomonas schloesseri]|uniref:SET domain-containing protein n=1 Tax=Chlamydomonas schloesseri TaxID=2026947 RepID=A0A835WB43_9CHLO|nr:hypothetical protein HYH02_009063 [Chlamydomonas schloesseri]|eukprot:KAG2444122.1 hypothetical protein HYH02_009063 [Chlamydomonas schloesseri]